MNRQSRWEREREENFQTFQPTFKARPSFRGASGAAFFAENIAGQWRAECLPTTDMLNGHNARPQKEIKTILKDFVGRLLSLTFCASRHNLLKISQYIVIALKLVNNL